jgi:hypothetical protein
MSDATDYREALRALLETDLGIDMVAGYSDGPIENRDLGFVFIQATEPWEESAVMENVYLGVHVFQRFEDKVDPEAGLDTTHLEELSETLKASVKAHQTVGAVPWSQDLGRMDFNWERQGFSATVRGWRLNPAL